MIIFFVTSEEFQYDMISYEYDTAGSRTVKICISIIFIYLSYIIYDMSSTYVINMISQCYRMIMIRREGRLLWNAIS